MLTARTHQPGKVVMRGREAGREAGAAASRALRLVEEAMAALRTAPPSPHRDDGLPALCRARNALVEAVACSDALKRGL